MECGKRWDQVYILGEINSRYITLATPSTCAPRVVTGVEVHLKFETEQPCQSFSSPFLLAGKRGHRLMWRPNDFTGRIAGQDES